MAKKYGIPVGLNAGEHLDEFKRRLPSGYKVAHVDSFVDMNIEGKVVPSVEGHLQTPDGKVYFSLTFNKQQPAQAILGIEHSELGRKAMKAIGHVYGKPALKVISRVSGEPHMVNYYYFHKTDAEMGSLKDLMKGHPFFEIIK